MPDQQVTPNVTIEPLTEMPIPECVQIGHTFVTSDDQEFLQAIQWGIQAHFDCYSTQKQISERTMLEEFLETFEDEQEIDEWQLGFLFGRVVGMLNPELREGKPAGAWLELLSHKCARCYPK
ncbi:hypothetical protein EPA93_09955 [Ktedonosporobacter rubrisoli]|uniref:Uncharacterized protein n=1 Tax=Ktedonosporobacter rubrisoli TaxID=2509675 RepID=A0A4P6JMQ8_KTERU|nr:hypothetical protein [Ktedonosporobacter rubrisoli]QBD76312.1 hypothetical protein EPA93_09955 [Ktedonosporobacter rubrisoli]